MFLLPSLALGLIFALALGGKPSRIADVRFRLAWTIPVALIVQALIFSQLGAGLPTTLRDTAHLGTYGLLLLFAVANLRVRALWLLLLGLLLNTVAITANGGRMPVLASAAHAARIDPDTHANVALGTSYLPFLGDVFALPAQFPLANVFSVGDIFIGLGMIAFIVLGSLDEKRERTLVPSRLLVPLREPSYRLLAAGKLVSHTGDWITLAALVGWIYAETNSTGQAALLLLSRLAPPILGGGVAAYFVDRVSKKRVLLFVEYARGAAVLGALLGVATGRPFLVFAAIACSGALAALSNAAVPAMLPGLLPSEQLPSANAGLGIAKDGAMAAGALGAGLLLRWIDVRAALLADLGTFAVAVCLFSFIACPTVLMREPGEEKERGALHYVLARRWLLTLVFSFAAATLATGLTNATLPRFLDQVLGLGSGGYGFGIGALAIGLAAGQALVGFSRVGEGAGRWIGAALAVMAGLLMTLALTTHTPTAILLLVAIGLVDGTTDVLFETVVQRKADPRYLGAVFGFSYAFITTTMMSAVAVAPLLNSVFAPRGVLVAASCFLVVASAIALLGMPRSRKGAAQPDESSGREAQVIELEPPPLPKPVNAEARFARGVTAVNAIFGPKLRTPIDATDWSQMLALHEIARAQTPPAPSGSSHLERAAAAISAVFTDRLRAPLSADDWRQLLAIDEIAQEQIAARDEAPSLGAAARASTVPDELG